MRAGKLRRYVTVIETTWTDSTTTGERIVTQSTLFLHRPMQVETIEANEEIQSGQRRMVRTCKFVSRYSSKINETMRLAYGGNTFEIQKMDDVNEAHRELIIVGRQVT